MAIPIGGWWVYSNFTAEDTHEANPNITVSAEVQPYDDTRRLLVVHVKPKNLGKVPIELHGGNKGDIDVLVKTFPAGLANGRVDQDKLPVAFKALGIISKYSGGYVMEPGIDYDEIQTFIVPKGATYLVYTDMDYFDSGHPDDEVDDSVVAKVD
ncbi:hypothetical protein ACT2FY_32250 [Paraburkholderia fungorum]|uniref:hypothetical protein n=1 Tax=Paraburkholderia fungorum TaxID=134537 RepID=UPI00402B2006